MPKGYWKADGQFLKGIGNLLGNAPHRQLIGEQAELPSSCRQNRGNFHSFPLNCFISVNINKKSKTD
jgi:hypothetical protein